MDTNILWFRSSAPMAPADVPHVVKAVRWCLSPANWLDVLRTLARDVLAVPLYYALALLVVAAMLGFSRRFRAEMHRLAGLVSDIETDSIRHTLRAMLLTLLLALPWPVLAAFLGWRLQVGGGLAGGGPGGGRGPLGGGRGPADHRPAAPHLHGGRPGAAALPLAQPPLAGGPAQPGLAAAAGRAGRRSWWRPSAPSRRWPGRSPPAGSAWCCLLVVMAMFAARVLRFRGGMLQEAMARRPDGWLNRMRYLWYLAAVGVPLALAAAAAAGFYYTAVVLGLRLVWTAWLLLALMLVYEFLMRLLFVLRRRLAREQMRKRRAAEQAQRAEKEPAEAPAVAWRSRRSPSTPSALRRSSSSAAASGWRWPWCSTWSGGTCCRRWASWAG